MPDEPIDTAALLQAEHLSFSHHGVEVLKHLSFSVHPGLTLVLGGDGRGKTTLLRLMAGTWAATGGVIRRSAETVFHEDMADPAHDAVVARAWLAARRSHLPEWDSAAAAALIDAFGLAEHIDKPLYMLSTGSRRKVGLLAAAVGHARLTRTLTAARTQVRARIDLCRSAGCGYWVQAGFSPRSWKALS